MNFNDDVLYGWKVNKGEVFDEFYECDDNLKWMILISGWNLLLWRILLAH